MSIYLNAKLSHGARQARFCRMGCAFGWRREGEMWCDAGMVGSATEKAAAYAVWLEGVSKWFTSAGTLVEPLQQVTWGVEKGAFAVMMGPSGSGKTTLLGIAGLLQQPDEGRIWLAGHPLDQAGERERCELRRSAIGMVFQSFHLLPHRSVLENVLFRFRYAPSRQRKPKQERAAALAVLDRLGLAPAAGRPSRLLSAGEAQRVAIARAIVEPPLLLLADEPTGNLDEASADRVMAVFRELHQEGMTVLVVTHNPVWLEAGTTHWELRQGRPHRINPSIA